MRKLTEYPTLSLQERDRRWANVRKEMAARGWTVTENVPVSFEVIQTQAKSAPQK